MPKISVIIPCYNHGQYIDEAVESVLNSTFKDVEIIIINDGSTDYFTNEYLGNYQKRKTMVYRTENQGLPAARNLGIKKAQGEYILALDADDKIQSTYLEKAVTFLENNKQYGFVTAWVQNFGFRTDIYKPKKYNIIQLLTENCLVVPSVFKKECWEAVGGYATDMTGYHDWEFWIKLLEKGYKYHVIAEPLILYRNRNDSMLRTSNKSENRQRLFGQIIDKHSDLYQKYAKDIILLKDKKYFSLRQKIESLIPRRLYYMILKWQKKKERFEF